MISLSKLIIVYVLISLIGVAGGLFILSHDTNVLNKFNAPPPLTTLVPSTPKGDEPVVVFLDGWSQKILNTTTLKYATARIPDDTTSSQQSVTLTPVTAQLFAQSLKISPTLSDTALARLYSLDSGSFCNSSICLIGRNDISPQDLLNPTLLPKMGPEFKGYHITHGLYAAVLYVKVGTPFIKFSTRNFSGYISLSTPLKSTLKATPLKTYGKNFLPLSAAFGQIFTDTPIYNSSPYAYTQNGGTSSNSPAAQSNFLNQLVNLGAHGGPGIFEYGLSTPVPAAASLSPSALTFFSSPATGCGTGILCVPIKAHPQVKLNKSPIIATNYCLVNDPAHVTLDLQDLRVTYRYPAPTLQEGIWNKYTPAPQNLTVAGLWPPTPPLVMGTSVQRQEVIYVVSSNGLSDILGVSVQVGVDPSSYVSSPFTLSSALSLYPSYHTC
jgi:hypothetical protein